jgi:hypothetical protein
MKAVVAQPFIREPLQRGSVDWLSKRAHVSETDVIEEEQQDIERPLGCLRHLGNLGLRIGVERSDVSTEFRFGKR